LTVPCGDREGVKAREGEAIRPRVAERISFDEVVAEEHHGLEAGGLEGKFVLCPDLPSRRDQVRA
jgi:hypothetical protein